MSEPEVSAEVVERLARVIGDQYGDYPTESDDRQSVRNLVAHLRSHPEDAAAVLGGSLYGDTIIVPDWPLPSDATRPDAGTAPADFPQEAAP